MRVGDGEPEQQPQQGGDEGKTGEEAEAEMKAKAADMSDAILDRWEAEQPDKVKQAAVSSYIENGSADPEAAGLGQLEAQMVVTAYSNHVEDKILKPEGLTLDVWNSYIDEDELPTLRGAVVQGDWNKLHAHASKTAAYNQHLEAEVCAPHGLTVENFLEHVGHSDRRLFREAVANGQWEWLSTWAQSIAQHRASKAQR